MTEKPAQKPIGARLHPSRRRIPEGLDEAVIGLVVERFYAAARIDPVMGPIFDRVIAADDWPRHLALIADFWSSMLLGTGRYSGRPMPKHMAIADLDDHHFERWLGLFRQVVEEVSSAEAAALFVERAERVAHSLRIGLAMRRGGDAIDLAVLRAPHEVKPQ